MITSARHALDRWLIGGERDGEQLTKYAIKRPNRQG